MKNHTARFRIHSNGKLRSIVTANGQGGLFYDWVALTRFADHTPNACGPMVYLREDDLTVLAENGESLSDLSVTLESGIAPGVDIEIRKITLSNQAARVRQIELTTYAEVALNHPLGDAGHPAFSKLFVQTSVADERPILLARRRPRGDNESWPWMGQTLIADAANLSWESNRVTFLGRGRTLLDPLAMDHPGALSCATGNVLDPIMAWRCELTLGPHESKSVWLLTTAAVDQATAVATLLKYPTAAAAGFLLDEAKADEVARLQQLQIEPADAARYEAMAETMLLGRRERRVPSSLAGSDVIHRFPLSGDEIRVITTESHSHDLIAALPFWRSLGLQVRIYVMDGMVGEPLPEGVILTDSATFSADQLAWWFASAQLVIGIDPIEMLGAKPGFFAKSTLANSSPDLSESLQHFNGYGGFSADGREYVILMALENGRLRLPPMPWINVLANPNFGCTVSDRGAGYTWSRNSQANRITPWSNDPVCDPYGEAFYLRDEESNTVWSPLPGPCPAQRSFVVRHGFGRTRFISSHAQISQVVEFLVTPADPVKLVSIRLKNESSTTRRLVFSHFHQLLLASTADRHHATLTWTDDTGVQHATNPRAGDFAGGRVFSFIAVHGAVTQGEESNNSIAAFLGAGGIAQPSALTCSNAWKNAGGFGRDACFSRKLSFTLPAGREIEIIIGLGEVMNDADETSLIERYRCAGAMSAASAHTEAYWQKMLGGIKIKTPLPEVDLMVNGWLTYQNLACRIWGRSAFYQSSGAYGFRDQLQDSGALAAFHPALMRSQILLHAAQQFPQGDVTHWWHPAPMGRGMRTKFADDLLWLPYLTDHYLTVTGDHSILDEMRSFIEGPLLAVGEDEAYLKPNVSDQQASVFEHCCLAIDKSLTKGAHGLPLMGIGDWNDGMSRIGREGRGESVWMGFFLFAILNRWIPLCESRGDSERAETYSAFRDELLTAINDAGWDGDWYRRAYYDDGTPLGTHSDDECQIDALAQAWAVISKAAPAERVSKSLDSLTRELIDNDIIRLLHPPFVNTPHDPGYIKGYVAGVRENGGQYTHAACWVIRAMAEAGRKDEAAKLLQRLSPIWHSRDAAAVARYQVEPYVVAADIYGAAPHIGRGGWTWYTGSAGWMFRVAVESVLGLRLENGNTLVLDPRVPDNWPGFSIHYGTPSGRTFYQIEVVISGGKAGRVTALTVDDIAIRLESAAARWPMLDDGQNHSVMITLGA